MDIINRMLNSFIFWAAWISIPLIMEIAPSFGSLFILLKRKWFPVRDVKPEIDPEITIIIPVYNSGQTLEACIRSIAESDYPDHCINVFLVNNQSRDDSFQVYMECQKKYPSLMMRWMNAEQGKSRALNLALYNSDGKYIIHIDSDGILERSAIRNMVERFESDPTVNVMTGAVCTQPELVEEYPRGFPRLLRKLEFMEYAQAFLAGRNYASETDSIYTLSGAFSGFRKLSILKSWLYSTDTICEDTQITFQMKYIQHEKVKISEKSLFFVDPIESMDKLYTQRQRWQRGSLEVAKLFSGNGLNPGKMLKDVNVRTLMYDHTFAFPRLIWYLALICLVSIGFSVRTIGLSMAAIMALYTLCGYFYYFAILGFLDEFTELKRYYRKQWWTIPLLPFFNFFVFFIRVIGIINSIGTDSAWKTKTLTEERKDFKRQVREDFSTFRRGYEKVSALFNRDEAREQLPVKKKKVWYLGVGLVYLLAVILAGAGFWVKSTYGIGFGELVAILLSPTKGTGTEVIVKVLKFAVPLLTAFLLLYVLAAWFCSRRENFVLAERILAWGAVLSLAASLVYNNAVYDILGYLQSRAGKTLVYEQYYVDPREVAIRAPGEKKNLIYVYVESLETTYASGTEGGAQAVNYMPGLTALAKENVSFSDDDRLGGFSCVNGTGFTMAALFAGTAGVPYVLDAIQSEQDGDVAPGIITLGDVLSRMGYRQEFLCGSDGDFGGRKSYFTRHGGYEVFDLFTAREKGYVPEDYYVWWGFEDSVLYRIAKDEILRLAAGDEPFNFTMLTVDAHHVDGYVCDLCGDQYEERTANVIACTDRQLTAFIEWCKEQDFYEDTVIVISGDHPRMDTSLVGGVSYYDRTIYNCFLNAAPQGEIRDRYRIFTTMDMFPTVMAAMGFEIEGNRLGLGTNLFSGEKTLAESMGFHRLDEELSKSSDYYTEHFLK